LYNHGFIVASANATIAFDLTRAGSSKSDSFALSDSLTRLLIDECDILFVSHWHQDHADDWVAENFLSQHKTVVSPDSVWIDKPFYASITHPVRSADSIYRIGLRGNHTIKYRAMPGHQGNVLNNVYIVTMPDGLTFAHTGDQYNPDDFSWIDSVRTHFRIDGLFLNSWSLNVYRLIKGFSPRFIFPSHEDELGHPIDHREAYWLTMDKFRDLPQKVIYMTWGEVFHIDQ
jgi:L-ascorbate metabolism protein UlaG (beta-lactamase superfamily)